MDLAFVPSANTFTSAALALLLRILYRNRIYRGVSEFFLTLTQLIQTFPYTHLHPSPKCGLSGFRGMAGGA